MARGTEYAKTGMQEITWSHVLGIGGTSGDENFKGWLSTKSWEIAW